MNYTKRVLPLLLAIVASVGLVACGGSNHSATSSDTELLDNTEGTVGENSELGATIVVENGVPVRGVEELEYNAGDQIRFTVESDVADEVHVHGYDLKKEVPAGGRVTFSFPADIEGIFEVELEGRKEQIAELRVNP